MASFATRSRVSFEDPGEAYTKGVKRLRGWIERLTEQRDIESFKC